MSIQIVAIGPVVQPQTEFASIKAELEGIRSQLEESQLEDDVTKEIREWHNNFLKAINLTENTDEVNRFITILKKILTDPDTEITYIDESHPNVQYMLNWLISHQAFSRTVKISDEVRIQRIIDEVLKGGLSDEFEAFVNEIADTEFNEIDEESDIFNAEMTSEIENEKVKDKATFEKLKAELKECEDKIKKIDTQIEAVKSKLKGVKDAISQAKEKELQLEKVIKETEKLVEESRKRRTVGFLETFGYFLGSIAATKLSNDGLNASGVNIRSTVAGDTSGGKVTLIKDF